MKIAPQSKGPFWPYKPEVETARKDIAANSRVTDSTYRVLVWLHPRVQDPDGSKLWGFIEMWRRQFYCSMPVTCDERDWLVSLFADIGLPNES